MPISLTDSSYSQQAESSRDQFVILPGTALTTIETLIDSQSSPLMDFINVMSFVRFLDPAVALAFAH